MKTAEQIIAYLEQEKEKAYAIHKEAEGKDTQKALAHIMKAITIQNLLEGIMATDHPAAEEPRAITPGHLEKMLMNGEITEEEYKKKKVLYVETLFELYERDLITEEELKERLNK